MYSLKSFIAITPSLVDFTIDYLKGLTKKDPIHDIYYKTAMITILDHIETKELDMITILNETLDPLLSLLNDLPPRDADSARLMNCMSDLLNIQTNFLLICLEEFSRVSNFFLAISKFELVHVSKEKHKTL